MPELPKIGDKDRMKPLTYDPKTGQFVTYDQIVDGNATVVLPENLSQEELTSLVVERHRVGPDYKMGDLSGKMLNRDQVVQEIKHGTSFGKMVVQAEASYLSDLLGQINAALKVKGPN